MPASAEPPRASAARDPLPVARELAREFGQTAAERDRQGGTPKRERDALRVSGLLTLVVPAGLGGWGASWATVLETVRTIARADGSMAHVFGFQHLLLATVRLFGTAAQFEPLARRTVEERWFWGNALNPLDARTTLTRAADGYLIQGEKSFCSGARDADMLIVSATDAASGKLVVAAIPAARAGVTAHGDWNNMGQRQTDSGSVSFDRVRVAEEEILSQPGPLGSTFATLRPLIAQLSLCNVYLGIAEGALALARQLTRERERAWFASSVERITDDPYVLGTFGDLFVALESARHATDAAAVALNRAWKQEDGLTESERGSCAVAIAVAKVVTTHAGLDVVNRMFDGAGARATSARFSLDRFWRDLRTHTLHDPVDYKRRDLGRFLLTGDWPKPSFYS